MSAARLCCVLAVLSGSAALAQEREIAPNQSTERFDERSPLSTLAEQTKRLGWSEAIQKDEASDYDLAKESFRLYVPKKKKGRRYGLVVWIAPGPLGIIPPWWEKPLRKRGLIAVGANESGNPRPEPVRLGLALDAAHAVAKRYPVDPKRVYVAGFSGGSNMSCMLTFHYPEVFRGGIYLAGAQYVRDVPIPDQPGRNWIGGIPPTTPERLTRVKERTRHVWLTGAKDLPNLAQTKAVHGLTIEDGFLNSTYLEVPKLAHQIPNPKWFDKCLRLVEKKPKTPQKSEQPSAPRER